MELQSFQAENDQHICITRPGRRPVLVRSQHARFDELFLFQGLQNRMQRSERYVCRFGQYSYFRLNPYS